MKKSFLKNRITSFCVCGRQNVCTSNLHGDKTADGWKIIIDNCTNCDKIISRCVFDNTTKVEKLSHLLTNIRKLFAEAEIKLAIKLKKISGKFWK